MQIARIKTKCSSCGEATLGLQAWSDHQWAKHRKETQLFHDALEDMTVPSKRFPGLREARKDWLTYTPKI